MTIESEESLARKLWALYVEARGYIAEALITWEDLTPVNREAWIQVAQYIDAQYRNVKHQPTQESERSPYNGHRYFLNPNEPPDHR